VRSELGIRADKSWAMRDGIFTLRGRLAWAHDYDPIDPSHPLPDAAGRELCRQRRRQASDSALVTASLEKKWLTGWSAAATFEASLRRHALLRRQGRGAVHVVTPSAGMA